MRKKETVKITGPDGNMQDVTVNELTVENILSLGKELQGIGDQSTELTGMVQQAEIFMALCVEGVDMESIQQLTPSEIQELIEAFKRVNSVFFDQVVIPMGLDVALKDMITAIKSDFTRVFVNSLSEDIPGSSDTVITSS